MNIWGRMITKDFLIGLPLLLAIAGILVVLLKFAGNYPMMDQHKIARDAYLFDGLLYPTETKYARK